MRLYELLAAISGLEKMGEYDDIEIKGIAYD